MLLQTTFGLCELKVTSALKYSDVTETLSTNNNGTIKTLTKTDWHKRSRTSTLKQTGLIDPVQIR
jgi:hypothetical protein